ncbi:MAG: DNA polymerase IV [Dehalococcoidia bacterium]
MDRPPSVLHVDLDAFYVSMELLRHPELRGLPVVVGHPGPRGVVSTASYEARRFGVRSAMPSSTARQLCPGAVWLRPDFSYYGPASTAFHAILRDFTPAVEPAGADEAYLDVHGSERLFGTGPEIAASIRQRVHAEVGITASVGVSANKLVSKVASDAAKPDGMLVVPPGTEAAFLAPMNVRALPMIGAKTAAALEGLGVTTIGNLAALPESLVVAKFGNHGRELRERALGRYAAPVAEGRGNARSVSRETTFGEDEHDGARLRAILRGQAERIAADLGRGGRSARTVTLKLRFPPFETVTRARSAGTVDLASDIYDAAVALFEAVWAENGRRPVRLIGVGVTGLQPRARQLRLGETAARDTLAGTIAAVREKFGDGSLLRAAELGDRH